MLRYTVVQDEKGFTGFSVVDSEKTQGDNAEQAVVAIFPFGSDSEQSAEAGDRAQGLADLLNNQAGVIRHLQSSIYEIIDLANYGPSSDVDHCVRYLEQIGQTAKAAVGHA